MISLPLAFWSPGPGEMLVIGLVALLLYGGDLPRVAKSWGKTLSEFRRGLSGIQDEINDAIYTESKVAPPKLEYHPEFHRDDKRGDAGATDEPKAMGPVIAEQTGVTSATEDSATKENSVAQTVDEIQPESDRGFEDRAAVESADSKKPAPASDLTNNPAPGESHQ